MNSDDVVALQLVAGLNDRAGERALLGGRHDPQVGSSAVILIFPNASHSLAKRARTQRSARASLWAPHRDR
jgi:hypothetical protein